MQYQLVKRILDINSISFFFCETIRREKNKGVTLHGLFSFRVLKRGLAVSSNMHDQPYTRHLIILCTFGDSLFDLRMHLTLGIPTSLEGAADTIRMLSQHF